ncbi:MAG TPA: hypothetical protein DDY44_01795 [Candidatus Moranbacteria bacterium]|nr:hypothetical protein [Candidatus Moranbacteria bacterium]
MGVIGIRKNIKSKNWGLKIISAFFALSFFFVAVASAEVAPTISEISPNNGLPEGGTSVTITGTNFSQSTIDANTKLLIQGNGTGASFVDSEITPKTVTAVGNVTQSSAQSKFGGSSVYLDGNGDYLSLADSEDWAFGTGDFTMDMWVKTTESDGFLLSQMPSNGAAGVASFYSVVSVDGKVIFVPDYVSYPSHHTITSTVSVNDDAWHHIAFVRNGAYIRMYIDGTESGTALNMGAGFTMTNSAELLKIGSIGLPENYSPYGGYIDEIRVSKGIARWTSNFTPPSSENHLQSTLTIGGTSATNIAVTSPTTITATTPAHAAGAADVVVTNYDGQSATLTSGYTFNAAPTISAGAVTPASAKLTGGDTITITGSGFYGTPSVTLGGTAATAVTVVNPTTITATTPAHSVGAVDVVITNEDSQSATLANGFTFTELPPTVSGISPSAGSPAGGTSVTISGTNFLVGDVDTYTKVLLHGDGTGASFVDSELIPKVVTAVGNATQSAAQSKFGGKSMYFDGSGDYLDLATSADFGLGTGDFTVDCWVNFSTVTNAIFVNTTSSANGFFFQYYNNAFTFGQNNVGFVINTPWTPSINTWYHIAVTRASGTTKGFINGTQIASVSDNYNYANNILRVGESVNGYLDEVRVSKGIARWTSNFTPPSAEYHSQPMLTFGGIYATNVAVTNPTTITATTPAHTAGATDVVVTNYDGQSATLTSGYTFNPAPTISAGAVSPASALKTGGDTITITGTGFYGTPTVTLGGTAATAVTVVNPTTITATTPAHSVGAVDVVITNEDSQSATLANGFTFTELPSTVGSISPNNGTVAGGTNVTITGTNFIENSATGGTITTSGEYTVHTFTGSGTFVPNNEMDVEVLVVAGGGGGGGGEPSAGDSGGGGGAGGYRTANLTISSESHNVTVGAGGAGAAGTSLPGNKGNDSIFDSITAAGGGAGGIEGGSGGAGGSGGGAGGLCSVPVSGGAGNTPATTPSQGNNGGFTPGTTCSGRAGSGGGGAGGVGGAGTTVSGAGGAGVASDITGTSITRAVGGAGGQSGSGTGTAGAANTGNGGKGGGISSAGGAGGSGVVIVRYLTHKPVVTIGGTSATNVAVTSPTTITATTPAHTAGTADVVVTNYDGQSATLTNGYTFNPAPTISAGAVSPASAKLTGGDTITITGTGFYGTPTVTLGGTAATAVTVVNPTTITATTPAHSVGAVDVVITNEDSQSATLTNGFTFTELPPTLSSISPDNGPVAGGTNVTISGTNFVAGSVSAIGGTITTDGDYTVHTFTGSGTFTADSDMPVEVLVVAGGGGGAGMAESGGGGGGGVQHHTSWPINAGANYSVVVGNGGLGATSVSNGANGANSSFGELIANGGGGGGGFIGLTPGSGGSGGGSTRGVAAGLSNQISINGSNSYGNPGGVGWPSGYTAGGGGGAGSAGGNATSGVYPDGGVGGAGRAFDISGTSTYYAGGGGGIYAYGGIGGGGNGNMGTVESYNGVANTGGGGGGGANVVGGDGGSGIVIVRYLTKAKLPTVIIDGIAATNVSLVNPTTITATTPAHTAGATDVVVTNYDGQSATLTSAFEYHNWITAGTYTSTVKPLANVGFGNIDWVAGTPANTNLTMRVKSCTSADCSDKPSWSGCDLAALDNGTDISGKGCVVDGQGYVQYQAYLSTDSNSAQPYLDSVTISTQPEYSKTFLSLISSPFDTGNESNSVQKISWTATNDNLATQGQVAIQIRTAPDNGGIPDFTNSVWCGPTDCSGTTNSTTAFAISYYTDKTGALAINAINKDLSDDRWIQYATFLKSADGTLTPTLTDVTMQYAYNTPPAITIDSNPIFLKQNADGTFSVPYTLSETYDDFGNIPHGTAGSPIKALLFYQPKNDITIEELTNVRTGIVTLNNPSNLPIPSQGSMLIGDELMTFDSVGATGNQRNITARGIAFATSYPTTAAAHLANSAVFFATSASIQTIDTLVETGIVGAEASVSNMFSWNPRTDVNTNLNGNKLSDVVFKVAANDADSTNINNIGQSSATTSQVLDLESPLIKNVTSSSADGKYNAGKNVDVTINFADSLGNAKNVTSTGAVTIVLETGVNDYECLIPSITNASSASCTYQVQTGDVSEDLTAISVSGTIKDQFQNTLSNFAIPAGQNIADSKAIVIDTISPIISGVSPAASAFVNSITSANGGSDISYEATELLKTGSYVKFTSTSGTDLNTEYLCTLQGTALEVGVHSGFEIKQDANNCTEVQSALQSGSVYTMTIHAIDEADNASDQTIANINFDTTNPTASVTSPSNDAFFNSITTGSDVSYNLDEQLQAGSYLKFTRTAGSADGSSPRTCNLTGTELEEGDHNNVDLNAVCGGFALVDGAVYSIDLFAKDLAGNEANATQKTNVTFDQTAPTLNSFTSDKANNTPATAYGAGEVIDIKAVYSESLAVGSTMTVRLENTATPAVDVVLDQIAGNVLSGTFVVDGPRKGYDTADLTLRSIVSQNAIDQAGNVKTDSAIPFGQNLGDNKDIAIDTGTPILESFAAQKLPENSTSGSYKAGTEIKITATYSKPIASGEITLHLNTQNGAEDIENIVLSTISGSTIFGTHTVQNLDNAEDLKVFAITAQSVTDFKGNVLDRTGTMTEYDAYFTSLVGENISAVTNISNFKIDTTAPTLGATPIAIANVAGKTSSATPVITLSATDNDISKAIFSLDGGTSWCAPIDYGATINTFDITSSACGGSASNEVKTVTVKFSDVAGNESATSSASVEYDNLKPQLQTITADVVGGIYGPNSVIKITATYDEDIASGTLVVNLNNGKQLTINTVETARTLVANYTVGATISGEDTSALRVAAIVSQAVSDSAANTQDGTSLAGITANIDTDKTIIIDTTAPSAAAPDGSIVADRASEENKIKITISPDDWGVAKDEMTAQIALMDTVVACNFTGANAAVFNSEFPKTFTYDDLAGAVKKVCVKLTDKAGNISSDFSVVTPNTPENFVYTDLTSATFTGAILKWDKPTQEGTGDFKQYNLLRCENAPCTLASSQTITDKNQNYYVFNNLDADTNYCYALTTQDVNNDISKITTPTICATPGDGPVATDTDVAFENDPFVANVSKTGASVVFKTIDSANANSPLATTASVEVYSDEGLTTLVKTVTDTLAVTHSVDIAGLDSGSNYYLKITATDTSIESNPNRSVTVSFASITPEKYYFATAGALSAITISNQPSILTDTKAVVDFSTDQNAKCFIDFKEAAVLEYNEVNNVIENEARKNHSITISPLLAQREYNYKITCVDDGDATNIITKGSSEGDLLPSFVTLAVGALTGEIDKTAPEISSVSLANVTGESATITWNTDEKANSSVAYEAEGASFTKMEADWLVNSDVAKYTTSHSVVINNLVSDTKYLFTVMSTDAAGNIALSSQSALTTKQPSTLSSIKVVSTALGQATITWSTGEASSSSVEYGLTTAYGQKKEDSSKVKEHQIILSELEPGETYHFRVKGQDAEGNIFSSSDITFQPKSPPKISDFRVDSITEHSAMIYFATSVPTDALITYTDANDATKAGLQGNPNITAKHEIKLRDLSSGATFGIKIKVRDEDGNETEETFPNITTTKDETPPIIDNIKTDAALAQNDKVQAIISWKTDEMSTGKIVYKEGKNGDEKTFEVNSAPAFSHIGVITSFKSGVVYYFKVIAIDQAGNEATSTNYGLLTPKKTQNIIQIIIGNFTEIFGWAKF